MRTIRSDWALGVAAAWAVAVVWIGAGPLAAQSPMSETEKEARKAVEKYFEAWNTGDNAKVRETLNFPFVTMGRNGSMVINQTAADYTTDFTRMREREGWHHSTLESLDATYVGSDRVHFNLVFNRYHPDNTRYMTGHMMYIATKKDGHWGMQLRGSIAAPGAGAAAGRE